MVKRLLKKIEAPGDLDSWDSVYKDNSDATLVGGLLLLSFTVGYITEPVWGLVVVSLITILGMAVKPAKKMTISVAGSICAWFLLVVFEGVDLLPETTREVFRTNSEGWKLMAFLIGLLMFISVVGRLGLFRWMTIKLVKRSNNGSQLATYLAMLSSGLTASTDEATGITIAKKVGLPLASHGKLAPDPKIYEHQLSIAVRFGNLTSGTTVLSNPVTILAALLLGLTLTDFIKLVWVPIIIAMVVGLRIMKSREPKEIDDMYKAAQEFEVQSDYTNRSLQIAALLMVSFLIAMVAHVELEHYYHLSEGALFVGIPLIAMAVAMVIGAGYDYPTTRTLKATGVLRKSIEDFFLHESATVVTIASLTFMIASLEVAGFVEEVSHLTESLIQWAPGPEMLILGLVIIGAGTIMTNLLDNVVTVLVLVKVIQDLSLSPENQLILAMLAVMVGTVTSSLSPVGSIGGIMKQLALKRTPGCHPMNFLKEWVPRYWHWTIITSIVSLVCYSIWVILLSRFDLIV